MKSNKFKGSNVIRLTVILISLLLMSSLSFQSGLAEQEITSLTLDFEEGIEEWEPTKETPGSGISLELLTGENETYLGDKCVKIEGTCSYAYGVNSTNSTLKVTEDTELSVHWMFENKNGAYTGIKLYTTDFGSLYIYSYFFGVFINTSYAGILEIYGESTHVWYEHTVDLYEAYMQIFDDVPETIDYIVLRNYPIGGGENPSGLITYFDNIIISGPSQNIISYPLIGLFLVVPFIVCVMICKNRRGCRM